MSVLQGQPPSYSEAQIISSIVGMSDPNLLTLTTQSARIAEGIQEEADPTPEDAAHFDLFKQRIYRHPLFPLLAMVFEKCEAATCFPDTSSHSFEKELKAFMKHHEGSETPLMDGEDEVNQLMLKAIQVLRIHLMEVEKVNELCKDFCARYISCLKSKLTSDSLLHVEGCDSPPPSSENSPTPGMMTISPTIQVQPSPVAPSVINGGMVLQQPQQPQIVSGNTVYQMVRTPQGIVAQPIQIQGPLTPLNQQAHQAIHGSTPLSQVGLALSSPPVPQQQTPQPQQRTPQPPLVQQQQQQSLPNQVPQNLSIQANKKAINVPSQSEDMDEEEKNGKQKRGVLPKQATQIMRSWLFQHIMHPYPTEDEKRQIASQTNLTLLQVNNWFINARRRILQPMLEVSNPDKSKAKKPVKSPTKPQHRFWPVQSESSSVEGGNQLVKMEDGEGQEIKALSSTSSKPPSLDRMVPSISMDSGPVTQTEALMGMVPNTNLILKVGPDGQIVPTSQVAMANPQPSITLESLQALQSAGLFLTHGASPMPLHLPFNGLTPVGGAAGLGLGMGTFPSLAAAASIMNLNAAAAAAYNPLQSTSLNAAPIDLSTMSNSAPIQLNTLVNGAANAQQLLMGLAYQGATANPMDRRDDGLENGELRIDMEEGMTDVS